MPEQSRDIESLYRAHAPALLGYLRRSFGPALPAEDLLQETFVQALRRMDKLAAARCPRGWLFGIARRVGLSALRRCRPHQPLPDLAAPPQRAGAEQVELVRRALALLPPAQREALELRLLEGLSYEEIAAALAVPLGTVRSRLHEAVRRLGEQLARQRGQSE